MALEHRPGGTYYYRSRREGGRVVKEYCGSGRVAELAAELDRLTAEERSFDRRAEADRLDEVDREADRVRTMLTRANELLAVVLAASGWHRRKREWRRRRGATTMTIDLAAVVQTWVPGELIARIRGQIDKPTLDKAAKGDRSVLPAVEKFLENPAAVALWGDAGRELLAAWVSRFAGSDLLAQEALYRFASDLRAGWSARTRTCWCGWWPNGW